MQDEFIMQIKDEDFTENLYSMCGHAKSIKNNLQTYQDKAESVIEHSQNYAGTTNDVISTNIDENPANASYALPVNGDTEFVNMDIAEASRT